jgi:hypothetical protein
MAFWTRPFKGDGPGNETVSGGGFSVNVNDDGTARGIVWPDGDRACIEERATRRTNESEEPRHDMDVDLIPDPNDPSTQWQPYLPGLVFTRNVTAAQRGTVAISDDINETNRWIYSLEDPTWTENIGLTTTSNFWNPSSTGTSYEAACPSPARKLGAITRSQLASYLGALRPQGYTYHEIGLAWGLRFMSRQGLFRDEHQAFDSSGAVQKHMIFMVDGQRDTRPFTYSAWGVAGTARRRTPIDVFPSRELENAVSEQRVEELCRVARGKGITLWVIAFGVELDDLLTDCASPGRAFEARNAAELNATFADIATHIAELRVTS